MIQLYIIGTIFYQLVSWYHSFKILVMLEVFKRGEMEARIELLQRGFETLLAMFQIRAPK